MIQAVLIYYYQPQIIPPHPECLHVNKTTWCDWVLLLLNLSAIKEIYIT